jgi:hypothetical protein
MVARLLHRRAEFCPRPVHFEFVEVKAVVRTIKMCSPRTSIIHSQIIHQCSMFHTHISFGLHELCVMLVSDSVVK